MDVIKRLQNHNIKPSEQRIAIMNYLMEHYPSGCEYPVLKVTQYPMPRKLIIQMYDLCDELLVLEDGYPMVEELLAGYYR